MAEEHTEQRAQPAPPEPKPDGASLEAMIGHDNSTVEMLVGIVESSTGDISKRLYLGPDGKPASDTSRCHLWNGNAKIVRVKGAMGFGKLISEMPKNTALTEGVPHGVEAGGSVRITTQAYLAGQTAAGGGEREIARAKESYTFLDGPSPMLFDCDSTGLDRPDNAAVKKKVDQAGGLDGAIFKALPGMEKAARVERASTSSGLSMTGPDGKEILFPDTGGKHIFPIVRDARDIPRAIRAAHQRMILAGYGWGYVTRGGQVQVRSPVDATVGSQERLVFEAAPEVELPLRQAKRDAIAVNGEVIDTRAVLPDLTAGEKRQFDSIVENIREKLEPEARAIREDRARKIAEEQSKRTGRPAGEIEQQLLACQGGRLRPDWPLKFDRLGPATVLDVLDNPEKYIGQTLADPVEPEYGGGRNKAIVLGSGDAIHSYAHGSTVYALDRGPQAAFDDGIEPDEAERNAASKNIAEAIVKAVREAGAKRRIDEWVGKNNVYKDKDYTALVAAAGIAINGPTGEAIFRAAIAQGLGPLEIEDLIKELAKSPAKLGKTTLRDSVKRLRKEVEALRKPTEDDQKAGNEERDRQLVLARDDLRASVSPLAMRQDLMDVFIAYIHDVGIIGETPAIVASFLTAVSRLLADKAGCLARVGAAASGKNIVPEKVLETLEPRPNAAYASNVAFLRISGNSPTSLTYYGGDDPDALKGLLIYIPEASSLLDATGNENPIVGMLRTLISEGHCHRIVTVQVKDPDGSTKHVAKEIVKNGPIAFLVTTARDNIEAELLTRLMLSHTDESPEQTRAVHRARIARASGFPPPRKSDTTLADWQDYQAFLGFGGPYDVSVPFHEALQVAFHGMPMPLRARRDIDGILIGVKASAIIHQMQRETDKKGRIIAALDDYKWSYTAFAPGLSALYRPQVGPGVIAIVKVIEQAIADQKARQAKKPNGAISSLDEVSLTHDQIATALGISSKELLATRIAKAITANVIEITNAGAPRFVPRSYRVIVPSKDMENQGRAFVGMPAPERVAELAGDMDAVFRGLADIEAEDARVAAAEAAKAAAGAPTEDGAEETADDDDAATTEQVGVEHDGF